MKTTKSWIAVGALVAMFGLGACGGEQDEAGQPVITEGGEQAAVDGAQTPYGYYCAIKSCYTNMTNCTYQTYSAKVSWCMSHCTSPYTVCSYYCNNYYSWYNITPTCTSSYNLRCTIYCYRS